MTLPLSKYYDPADYTELVEELKIVDQSFTSASPQSEHRRWEYAMALRAYAMWEGSRPISTPTVDVGGAGSPFWRMLPTSDLVSVIDPHEPSGETLAQYLRSDRSRLFSAVFCISVLEHVDDLDQFLYHLSCLVAPGGLLFLTMDCCGCDTHDAHTDPHHFHWMRTRIFTPPLLQELVNTLLCRYSFQLLGKRAPSLTCIPPQVYDYSFVSLALVKRS